MAQRRTQHSTDHKPQAATVSMPVTGEAELSREGIEVVDGPNAMHKAEQLAFNEELVKIMVHESTDLNEEQIVFSGVNGRRQYFIRGVAQVAKRKFVEALARAKPISYRQVVDVNQNTGHVMQKMIPKTALKYPFSILEDKNPNGTAWFRQIVNEA